MALLDAKVIPKSSHYVACLFVVRALFLQGALRGLLDLLGLLGLVGEWSGTFGFALGGRGRERGRRGTGQEEGAS